MAIAARGMNERNFAIGAWRSFDSELALIASVLDPFTILAGVAVDHHMPLPERLDSRLDDNVIQDECLVPCQPLLESMVMAGKTRGIRRFQLLEGVE